METEEKGYIDLSKHILFSKEHGTFCLKQETAELLYRQKELICSYGGAQEWCHHFVSEIIDLCSGSSIYNYALGTVKHESEIKKAFGINPDAVISWAEKLNVEAWGKKALCFVDYIIDNL